MKVINEYEEIKVPLENIKPGSVIRHLGRLLLVGAVRIDAVKTLVRKVGDAPTYDSDDRTWLVFIDIKTGDVDFVYFDGSVALVKGLKLEV